MVRPIQVASRNEEKSFIDRKGGLGEPNQESKAFHWLRCDDFFLDEFLGDSLDPCEGPTACTGESPRPLVCSSTAATRAPVLPRAPGPWGPTLGPGGRGKPQPSHPELGAGAAPDPAAPWGKWGDSRASPTVEPDVSGG